MLHMEIAGPPALTGNPADPVRIAARTV